MGTILRLPEKRQVQKEKNTVITTIYYRCFYLFLIKYLLPRFQALKPFYSRRSERIFITKNKEMRTINFLSGLFITVFTIESACSQENLDFMGFPNNDYEYSVENNPPAQTFKDAHEVQIEDKFASPVNLPSGIAWDGEFLWVCGYNAYNLYKVSPLNGNVVQTLPVTVQKPYGIAYSNNNLYIIDNTTKWVFEYNPVTGECTDTIMAGLVKDVIYPTGLFILNNQFIFNDTKGPQPGASGDSVFFFSQSNVFMSGLPSHGSFQSGITFDGRYLWINDNPSRTSNIIDFATWEVISSVNLPGGLYPNGITYDGSLMWVINNASDSIYSFSPSGITSAQLPIDNKLSVSVYPNPATDFLNIDCKNGDFSYIILRNSAGTEVLRKEAMPGVKNVSIDIKALSLNNGIYTVSLIGATSVVNGKVLVLE